MRKTEIIVYKNKPIRQFFSNLLNSLKNKLNPSIKFDDYTENLLKNEFTQEEQKNVRELLKELLSRNNKILETMDIRMLHENIVSAFGIATLERIVNDKILQQGILELSQAELQTYNYILNYKVADINERLGSFYQNKCKNIDLEKLLALDNKTKDKAISILLSESNFGLYSIDELEQYYENRKNICEQIINNPAIIEDEYDKYDELMDESSSNIPYNLIYEMKELTEAERIKYSIIEAKYGMSLEKAKILCDAFGEDINGVNSIEEKRIIQEIKEILKEKDIEKLKHISLDEDYKNYEGTMNIIPNLKNAYLEKYKETLYQINDKDYIGSQSIKIKGHKKKNIEIYNVLGKDNSNTDFNMILTSLGGIYNYYHDYTNFKNDWDRADDNHMISCSYIGNDNLATVDNNCLLAFADIDNNQILRARNQDLGVMNTPFEQLEELNNNKFLLPQNMINETKMYNEFAVERKVEKDGKLVNRTPSYVVFMANNLEEIYDENNPRWQQAKQMAADLEIPIAVIDVTKCTKLEYEKVQEMTKLVKEQNRFDLIPKILQKIENNKAAQMGELTNIRNDIFSSKNIRNILEQIIGKIAVSNKPSANIGIEEFVKTTKKIKRVYQNRENSASEKCQTFNYDEYIDRLKNLYISINGLNENSKMKTIDISKCDLNNDYFHFTNKRNINSILNNGLIAQVGIASKLVEDRPNVSISKGVKGIMGIINSFIYKFENELKIPEIPKEYRKYFTEITDFGQDKEISKELACNAMKRKLKDEVYFRVNPSEEQLEKANIGGITGYDINFPDSVGNNQLDVITDSNNKVLSAFDVTKFIFEKVKNIDIFKEFHPEFFYMFELEEKQSTQDDFGFSER